MGKRKQESKKERKHAFGQESDQGKKENMITVKKNRKKARSRPRKKTRTWPRTEERKQELDQ